MKINHSIRTRYAANFTGIYIFRICVFRICVFQNQEHVALQCKTERQGIGYFSSQC